MYQCICKGEIFEVSHGNFCHMDKLYCHLNDVDWWLPRDTLHQSLPQSFRKTFLKKTCIIDATELFTEHHSDRGLQSASFSRYKHHHTVKALVAISPCGHVMLVSQPIYWCNNRQGLTKQSGFSINLCLEIKSWQTKGLLLLTFSWTLGISCATSFSRRRRSVY